MQKKKRKEKKSKANFFFLRSTKSMLYYTNFNILVLVSHSTLRVYCSTIHRNTSSMYNMKSIYNFIVLFIECLTLSYICKYHYFYVLYNKIRPQNICWSLIWPKREPRSKLLKIWIFWSLFFIPPPFVGHEELSYL